MSKIDPEHACGLALLAVLAIVIIVLVERKKPHHENTTNAPSEEQEVEVPHHGFAMRRHRGSGGEMLVV